MRDALQAWRVAKAELDRLLQRRIDGLIGKMRLDLALIGAFAALSLVIAVLTHRHIVRPLERLEAVASKVRETKDYGLRVLYDGKDEIGRVTAAFNDMLSELAAARKRETAERAELARVTRLTTMGEMAASIAHEVNQPLAAIVSNANAGLRWLAHPTPDLTKVDAVLQRVVRDGHRASEVIGSVRAMFKRDVQEKRPLAVNAFIEEALALLQGQLESERISVHMELAEGAPCVLADKVQLQQVVLNLLANAIDAMRGVGDRPRSLRVAVAPGDADNVLISVAGLRTGHRPRGQGAHLRAVLHDQDQRHGARTGDLPLDRGGAWRTPVGDIRDSPRRRFSGHAAGLPSPGAVMPDTSDPQPLVFVIDDDAAVRESLVELFASVGLRVAAFGSTAEFLRGGIADVPSCLILDVRLPGSSGLDFQAELAKAGVELPIIFITGHGDIPMSVKAMKAGAVEFLTKPFRDQELLDAVQRAIELDRRQRKERQSVAQVQARFDALTAREQEVIRFVSTGLMNKQIAGKLGVTEITVKVHRANAMRKMGARSLADLLMMAQVLKLRPPA